MTTGMKKKILAVCQTPPPLHGQAVMGKYLVEGIYDDIEIIHVRMAFSEDLESVGKPGWRKLLVLVQLLGRIVRERFRSGTRVLYYPPASPHLPPVLRDIVILLAVRPLFQKVVFHFHAGGLPGYVSSLSGPLGIAARRAYARPDLAIVLGDFACGEVAAFEPARTVAIPNGIPDESKSQPALVEKKDPPILLFVGLVCEEKGVGTLLEACWLLLERGLRVECRIVGEGRSQSEWGALRAQAEKTGQSVRFLGRQAGSEKWRHFVEADLFCFPSHYVSEALPVVVAEALMFGLPVVATRWRGIPEMIEDGVSGFLVPTKDPVALADRLEALLSDSSQRSEMSVRARERFEEQFQVEKFWKRMGAALGSL